MNSGKTFLTVFFLTTAWACHAQIGFHANVTNLWYQGHKSNVLEIAEQRLSADTNDIAGLILRYEFQIAFLEVSSVSNSARRVLDVAQTITSANFARTFPEYSENIQAALDFLPHYTPAEVAEDKLKALIPHKPLVATDIIKALQDDGYFE